MEKKEMLTKTMLGMFIVMNFILNMSASLFNGILDQVAVEMNVPVTVTGQLSSMYQFGAGIGVPLFLIFAGRFKRENLLKAMLAVRFLIGVAGTCCSVLATATVSAKAPAGEIGKYLSLLIGGSAVANIIGVPSIRMLSSFMGWRQIMMGLVALMILVLMYFIVNVNYPAMNCQA